MRAGEIARRVACSWPTTTRHLRVLEVAGLVRVDKDGRERIYNLNAKALSRVVAGWVGNFDLNPPEESEQ